MRDFLEVSFSFFHVTTLLSDYHHTIQIFRSCVALQFRSHSVEDGKDARETADDILLGCVHKALPLPLSRNAGFMKETQAIAEIWAGVDKAWSAIHSITERQLGPYVVRRLNAQRYARQVLRAKEIIAFCGSKRNHTEPTRQRLRVLRQEHMEH